MNIDEIKRNAPEGATHYHKNIFGVKYYKRQNNDQLFSRYVEGDWIPSFISPHKPMPL